MYTIRNMQSYKNLQNPYRPKSPSCLKNNHGFHHLQRIKKSVPSSYMIPYWMLHDLLSTYRNNTLDTYNNNTLATYYTTPQSPTTMSSIATIVALRRFQKGSKSIKTPSRDIKGSQLFKKILKDSLRIYTNNIHDAYNKQ